MSSQAEVSVKLLFRLKTLYAAASFAGVESAGGEFVGNPHIKREAAMQLNLPIQQVNRFGGCQTDFGKNFFNFAFQIRFNPRADGRCLVHETSVALL